MPPRSRPTRTLIGSRHCRYEVFLHVDASPRRRARHIATRASSAECCGVYSTDLIKRMDYSDSNAFAFARFFAETRLPSSIDSTLLLVNSRRRLAPRDVERARADAARALPRARELPLLREDVLRERDERARARPVFAMVGPAQCRSRGRRNTCCAFALCLSGLEGQGTQAASIVRDTGTHLRADPV